MPVQKLIRATGFQRMTILVAILAILPVRGWAADEFETTLPVAAIHALVQRAAGLKTMQPEMRRVHDPFPPSADTLEMVGIVSRGCNATGENQSMSTCYERAIEFLAHPNLRVIGRACTGLPNWYDQALCFSRAFSQLPPLHVDYKSAKGVIRGMCTGLTNWSSQANCFTVAASQARMDAVRRACGDLSNLESRSRCYEHALGG